MVPLLRLLSILTLIAAFASFIFLPETVGKDNASPDRGCHPTLCATESGFQRPGMVASDSRESEAIHGNANFLVSQDGFLPGVTQYGSTANESTSEAA
jgi:hypothetical protein